MVLRLFVAERPESAHFEVSNYLGRLGNSYQLTASKRYPIKLVWTVGSTHDALSNTQDHKRDRSLSGRLSKALHTPYSIQRLVQEKTAGPWTRRV